MRNWRATLKALTSSPRGLNADGRVIGLGLATAMEKQRRLATSEVEDYLRTADTEPERVTTDA